jgi:uncharacterized repeat protein (TIGR01451 family)
MPGSLPIPDPISNPLVCTTASAPPSVAIIKTDKSVGPYAEGDTITYQISVTNTSTTDISNATLTDTLTGIFNISDPLGLLTGGVCINAGFTSLITYDYVVTNDNYVVGGVSNTATLTSASVSAQNSHFIGIDNSGVMNISKKVISNTIYTQGSTISYQVDVWNSGGSNVNNIRVFDILSPFTVTSDLSGIMGQGRTFIPGGAATCTYDYIVTADDVVQGNVTNEASINVQVGNNLPFVISDSTVTPLVEPGQFAFEKSIVTTGPYEVGDTITYDISILNLTPLTVTGITINDDLSPITYVSGNNNLLNSSVSLAPNEAAFVRYSYTAASGDEGTTLVNTATLTAANTTTQVVSASAAIDDAPVWNTQDTVWETTDEYDWEKSYEDFA